MMARKLVSLFVFLVLLDVGLIWLSVSLHYTGSPSVFVPSSTAPCTCPDTWPRPKRWVKQIYVMEI